MSDKLTTLKGDAYSQCGKQVLRNGEHYADARDVDAAILIARLLTAMPGAVLERAQ